MLYEGVPEDRMVKLLQIALKCIYKSADARPTMSQVAEMIHSLKEEEDRWKTLFICYTDDLGPKEKADALIKRAELSLGVGKRRRRVDQAIEDLTEAMKIGERSGKGLGLLGECYEWKGMIEEARRAYEEAIEVDGSMDLVRERLKGLREAAKRRRRGEEDLDKGFRAASWRYMKLELSTQRPGKVEVIIELSYEVQFVSKVGESSVEFGYITWENNENQVKSPVVFMWEGSN
ncbi:uncharacterized protein A4U43_C01F24300 [Asparagus officinalis]|uniref:Uncharacterized protein n=1 Tax=Asparagus officinalis TaxID=4686 RepID=A0A5P1FTL0_ASPOF|nr:uncharacterized protein A4U43_C01F24300 [Asparagus officinalis]